MAHMCMSHSTHINESCQAYEWVMAHIWIRRETCINESWLINKWVMAHIWMSHGTLMNASCDMAHIWMSHGTNMNTSWHTYEYVTRHGTHMNTSWSLEFYTLAVYSRRGLVYLQTHIWIMSRIRMIHSALSRILLAFVRRLEEDPSGWSRSWRSHVKHINESIDLEFGIVALCRRRGLLFFGCCPLGQEPPFWLICREDKVGRTRGKIGARQHSVDL